MAAKSSATNNDNDYSVEYEQCSVESVPCICWTFTNIDDTSAKANKQRKKVKDAIGYQHIDVPLLDSKQGKQGKEWCDIILFTKHHVEWEEAMENHYASLGHQTRSCCNPTATR
jgi:hypothetical protein